MIHGFDSLIWLFLKPTIQSYIPYIGAFRPKLVTIERTDQTSPAHSIDHYHPIVYGLRRYHRRIHKILNHLHFISSTSSPILVRVKQQKIYPSPCNLHLARSHIRLHLQPVIWRYTKPIISIKKSTGCSSFSSPTYSRIYSFNYNSTSTTLTVRLPWYWFVIQISTPAALCQAFSREAKGA